MAVQTSAALLQVLRRSGLLEPAQLAELPRLQGQLPPEGRACARALCQRGWLTPYQANLLLLGREKELQLGQYIILERLGEGGMGHVFKARHKTMGRVVALKVMRKERLANAEAVQRFRREIQVSAQLTHPNIVMAYDAAQAGETHFMVMEYVEGTDLLQLVKQQGPLPVLQACNCIRQAAEALHHAHEKGMIHRDVKPSNLLLTKTGQVKLLDLGLARTEDDEPTPANQLTKEGRILGTLDFLAPEQALNSRRIDGRADLYSLGCTFYYLLTGQVPFPGPASLEKLAKHRWEEPAPVETVRPGVPANVAAIVRKLMAKKPEDRYQTPAEVSALLSAVGGAAVPVSAPPPSAPAPRPPAPAPPVPQPEPVFYAQPANLPPAPPAATDSLPLDRYSWMLIAAGAFVLLVGSLVLLSVALRRGP